MHLKSIHDLVSYTFKKNWGKISIFKKVVNTIKMHLNFFLILTKNAVIFFFISLLVEY